MYRGPATSSAVRTVIPFSLVLIFVTGFRMHGSSNVEYLFENFTIDEIRDIQKKLQADIRKKTDDMKDLVK